MSSNWRKQDRVIRVLEAIERMRSIFEEATLSSGLYIETDRITLVAEI